MNPTRWKRPASSPDGMRGCRYAMVELESATRRPPFAGSRRGGYAQARIGVATPGLAPGDGLRLAAKAGLEPRGA